tara:strand:+ start:65 stop:778 length:714 start_codon:yes stop_codon:yes gene_type:complete
MTDNMTDLTFNTTAIENLLRQSNEALESIDKSIDFLAAAMTGMDPLQVNVAQAAMGRLQRTPGMPMSEPLPPPPGLAKEETIKIDPALLETAIETVIEEEIINSLTENEEPRELDEKPYKESLSKKEGIEIMKLTKQRLKKFIKEEMLEARSAAERGEEWDESRPPEEHPGSRRTRAVMKLEDAGESRDSALIQLLRHVQFSDEDLAVLERLIDVLVLERQREFREPLEDGSYITDV